MIYKTYRYRLYPTQAQKKALAGHFGAVRFVYNWGLATKKRAWEESKERISYNTLQAQLPPLKKQYEWLKDPYSQSLQLALQHLDSAFQGFFSGKGYPRFKAKSNRQALAFCPNPARPLLICFETGAIRLPKVEEPVKCVVSQVFTGKLKTVTVIKTPTGKYFAACLVEVDDELPQKPAPSESQAIGIDLGIKSFAVLSNGETIANPRYLSKSLKALRRASRKHSKKQKDGKNREKARMKLVRIHELVANQRRDFLHKITTNLVRQYKTLCIEDLGVRHLERNHKLARHINDASWSVFRELLTYKAEWYGRNLLVISRFAPSSKQCSCGVKNDALSLKDRIWTCVSCGTTHDRDLLAAQNIVRFAFKATD